MKRNLLFLVALTVVGFSSCSDDSKERTPEPESGFGDFIVPQDFNWKTTRRVLVDVQSNTALPVYVYNDEECSDKGLLAIYHLYPNAENSFSLVVPTYQDVVYLKYSTNDPVAVPIIDGKLTYEMPAKTRGACVECETGEEEYDYRYFPCKGDRATIMFEDLFPNKGDYDFNDFVANYNYICFMDKETKQIKQIDFSMEIVALGGLLGYDPCLRIDGIKTDFINKIAMYGDAVVRDYPDRDGEWCARFSAITKKPDGCMYLNTDPDERMIPRSELKTLRLVVDFKERQDAPTLADLKDIDVFITNDRIEIHERGDEPAQYDYPRFVDEGDDYYACNKNMVWSFTVPLQIAHAKERINILRAYPRFEDWVKSGGKSYQYWYDNINRENIMVVPEY